MTNYKFLACFKPVIYGAPTLKLYIYLDESPKHDNNYKLCLYMLAEHKLLNIKILTCSKAKVKHHSSKI